MATSWRHGSCRLLMFQLTTVVVTPTSLFGQSTFTRRRLRVGDPHL